MRIRYKKINNYLLSQLFNLNNRNLIIVVNLNTMTFTIEDDDISETLFDSSSCLQTEELSLSKIKGLAKEKLIELGVDLPKEVRQKRGKNGQLSFKIK